MHVGKNFTGLGSGRRYIASNFTDVIVNTQLNMSGIQNSAAHTLLLKRNIPMPIKGLNTNHLSRDHSFASPQPYGMSTIN